MQNEFKSNIWERISIYKTLKIEIQKGEQIIQIFCQIGST